MSIPQVKTVGVTQGQLLCAEDLIAYCARVSMRDNTWCQECGIAKEILTELGEL